MREWQPIATAPFERDLELAVLETVELHTLVFPCRRALRGSVNAKTAAPVNVYPTHWRKWDDAITLLPAVRFFLIS
jgi:hypothetical protein